MEEKEEIEFDERGHDSSDAVGFKSHKQHPEMYHEPSGWNIFSEEVSWYIYDFFKYDLNGYEKLLFYCYYINGWTLMEIAEAADCSFQYVGAQIKHIEKRLAYRWKYRESWELIHDCK